MSKLERLVGILFLIAFIFGSCLFLNKIALENLRAANLLESQGQRVAARLTSDLELRFNTNDGYSGIQYYEFSLKGIEYKGKRVRTKQEFLRDPYVLYMPSNPKLNADGTSDLRFRADLARKAIYGLVAGAAILSVFLATLYRRTSLP